MNRTHSPIGGGFSMFAPATSGERGSGWKRTTTSRLARYAGQATRTGEEAFGQLEARQMLFALFVPAGGAQATGSFGYYAPYLVREIPGWIDPIRVESTLEEFGVQPLFPGVFDLDPDADERSLFLDHAGFPNPGTFPDIRNPVPTAPGTTPLEEGELHVNLTGARTVTLGYASDTTLRLQAMYAMELRFFLPGAQIGMAPNVETIAASSTLVVNNISIQLFNGTQLVATFNNSGAPGTTNLTNSILQPDPTAMDPRVTLRLDPAEEAVFTRVVISAINGGDEFALQDIVGEFPPGKFQEYADSRIFGARSRVTGPSNGFLDAATVDPINRPDAVGASVNEIFDNDAGALNRRLATPTTFASGVRLTHANYAGGAEPQIVAGPAGGADRALSFTLTGTQTFSFSFVDASGVARPMPNFTFAVPSAGNQTLGAGTQIELLRNGRVVRTYQQADFDDPTVRITNALDPTQFIYVLDTVTETANFASNQFGQIINQGAAFDEVRVSRVGGAGTDAGGILIDRVSPFAPTMVEFFDLYGRPMRNTLAMIPNTADGATPEQIPSDINDDGVPEFNDGIGRILISNGSAATNFTIFGGEVIFDDILGYQFVNPADFTGNTGDYQDAGFGHALDPNQQDPTPIGLNPGMSTVIIGAPFWRDNTDDSLYHGLNTSDVGYEGDFSIFPNHADGSVIFPPFDLPLNRAADFSNVPIQDNLPNAPVVPQFQGIFTQLGQPIRNVNVHGTVYGSSDFGGAVSTFNVGHLLGSLTVRGDLGALFVAGDAGAYYIVPQPNTPANDGRGINTTGSVINILRNLGQANFGARNYARMTVFNDVNNANLGRLQFSAYAERENVPPFLGSQNPVASYFGAFLGGNLALMGDLGFRNDDFRAAEYVGHAGSFVTVTGTVGLLNDIQAEDGRDVYAFSATRGVPLVIDATLVAQTAGGQTGVVIVYDGTGREIARHELPFVSDDRLNGDAAVRFTIPGNLLQSDTYYVAVDINAAGGVNGGNEQITQTYTLAINGLAGVNNGAITNALNGPNFIELRGATGLFRSGVGINSSQGGIGMVAAHGSFETIEEVDDLLEPHGGSLLVQGRLYTMMFGSDIEGGNYTITGNLGSFRTGYFFGNPGGGGSAIAGGIAPGLLLGQGDLKAIRLDVGGRIEQMIVHGDFGNWSDGGDYLDGGQSVSGPGSIRIRTGLNGSGDGTIGLLNIGGLMVGQAVTITVFGASSTFAMRVNGGIFLGTPTITLPDGGTVTEIGTPAQAPNRPGIPVSNEFVIPIVFDVPLSLVSDSGVQYSIIITGGVSSRTSFGFVRTVPIVGAPGSALSAIGAVLAGGAELRVVSTTPGRLAIGQVDITTLPPAVGLPRPSSVTFAGAAEIDVSRVTQVRGDPAARDIDALVNATAGGDLGAVSVAGVNRVSVVGNIGGTLFPLLSNAIDNPIAFRDDFDPTNPGDVGGTRGNGQFSVLNGLQVLVGNVQSVTAGGFIQDVWLEGGDLLSLVPNSDSVTLTGAFEGIAGRIYANNIVSIDLGHGLLSAGSTSSPNAGIFAYGSIGTVSASMRGGVRPTVNGVIIASNALQPRAGLQAGIGNIAISNGLVDGAYFGVSTFDSYFTSPTTAAPQADPNTNPVPPDLAEDRGIIRNISLVNTSLFRSELLATSVTNVSISGGAFDASVITARQTIGNITASSFRNSTTNGEAGEFRVAQIFAGVSIARIATTGTGDISDLIVITDGSLLGGLSTRNATRLDLTVRQNMGPLTFSGDLRSSSLSVGNLSSLNIAGDLRASTLAAAGPVNAVNVRGSSTNTSITSTGINGRINSIVVGGAFSGTVTSSGPINSFNVTGALSGTVTTTDATDGDLLSIRAGGNLAATLNIAKNVNAIFAGGSFGTRPVAGGTRDIVDIQGTLGTLTATGQLYADVRVGQTINAITVGRVSATPANDLVGDPFITAFGRINSVVIAGDFGGNILSHSGGIGAITITNGSFRIGTDDDNSGVIDATERNRIEVRDGDLGALTIANGSLFGDVVARDGDIRAINVSGAGAFGRIGVDPALSTAAAVTGDTLRNQLPPGTPVGGSVNFDGPTISAGRDIVSINSTGGAFEVGIFAGRNVGTVATGGFNTDALGAVANSSYIAAGDAITSVVSRGQARGLTVLAGATSLGADGRVGGAAANADTLKTGRVQTVTVTGGSSSLAVTAGVNAGTDGLYNTLDGDNSETAVPGISSIGTVTVTGGAIVATTAFADATIGTTTAGITRSTGALPADARTFTGSTAGFVQITATGLAITTTFGENARAVFAGPGQAFWDAANNRIVLIGSTLGSSLRIDPIAPATALTTTLTNFGIVSNDDASLGSLIINAQLRSNTATDTADRSSRVFVDGTVNSLQVGNTVITADNALAGSGILAAGQDLVNVRVGNSGASPAANQFRLEGNGITTVTVLGDLGTSVASRIDGRSVGSVSVTGNIRGVVSSGTDITSIRASAALIGARIRAAGHIASVAAASASTQTRVSAGGNIQTITITGDANDSAFLAGTDLGTDGTFGGAGSAADRTTNGNIGSVVVGGNFQRSDITAGVARGADGFVNTTDDVVSDGRSAITSVRITGQLVGSNLGSQKFGILSTGTIGSAFVGNTAFTVPRGNFTKVALNRTATPVQITDIRVAERAPRQYSARLSVNQSLDTTTIGAALSIAEVRLAGQAEQTIALVQGTDYTFRFDSAANVLIVDFAESVTTRDLIGNAASNAVSQGVFRFTLDAAVLRGATSGASLDGNRDNNASGATDDYIEDAIVGDAGDRFVSGRTAFTDGNGNSTFVDFYTPASLDQLMDRNRGTDFLPDANRVFTLRGVLGDHADTGTGTFGAAGDIDLYTITLRAGQVLRLSALSGPAADAGRAIYDTQGNALHSNQSGSLDATRLQLVASNDPLDLGETFVVRQSGTYIIAVVPTDQVLVDFNPFGTVDPRDPTSAIGGNTAGGTSGNYDFTIEIFEDGDSGFFSTLPAPDAAIATANIPVPNDFAGMDAALGTLDDVVSINAPDDNGANPQYTFQLFAGADNTIGTADDIISGSNGIGVFVSRTAGPNNTFGDGDDVVTTTRTSLAGASPVDPDAGGPLTAVPLPNDFRGVDNTFGTNDDIVTISRTGTVGPNFTFVLLPGTDGTLGTADDIVRGANGQGILSIRQAGVDNAFGTGDDILRLTTSAGTGAALINPTILPSAFAGTDNVLGTADDRASISIGDYIFTLDRGTNRRFDGNGTVNVRSDDIVTGSRIVVGRDAPITSTRTAGTDGIFGTADDVFTNTASGAIGDPGSAGVPKTGQLDVDVYHLNGGSAIAPGTRIRATLKLTEMGGNIGALQPVLNQFGGVVAYRTIDNRGLVQFALFDTTDAVGLDDAILVAAPSDVVGVGGRTPGSTTDGSTTYGIDANGDYFFEFVAPPSVANSARAGSFALYVQGAVRSDYQVEVRTSGTGTLPTAGQVQNVLIDFNGGQIDWLEANPYTPTTLAPFDAGLAGFAGELNGVPAVDFLRQQILASLTAAFAAAGVNVVFSADAAAFEGQDFSTVFVTSGQPPRAFTNTTNFGESQGVDAFNANRNDQAVIYTVLLNGNGNAANLAGASNYANQLTAAIGRRVGELLGLRISAGVAQPPANTNVDVMAANSPTRNLTGTGQFVIDTGTRPLAGQGGGATGTQFLFGSIRAGDLLNRIFGNP